MNQSASSRLAAAASAEHSSRLRAGSSAKSPRTVPIAAFAEWEGEMLWLRARVGATDGSRLLEADARGADPEELGAGVADMLLSQGADALVRAARG